MKATTKTKGKLLLQWASKRWLILGLGASISTLALLFPQQLDRLELGLMEEAQELRGIRKVPNRVVIVGIDDFSLVQAANSDLSKEAELQTLQSWPWPRKAYGLVIERLVESGVKAVGLDLLLDTPSSHGKTDDNALAIALQQHIPTVVMGAQVLESRGNIAGLSLHTPHRNLVGDGSQFQLGLLNGYMDRDGAIRHRPNDYAKELKTTLGSSVPSSLAVSLLEAAGHPIAAETPWHGWQSLLDPYGPAGTIPTIPIWDVLDPDRFQQLRESKIFDQAIVLIGPTAAVLQDLHQTAFSGQTGMPGVEIHATELANRLEQRSLLFQPNSWAWSCLLGLVVITTAISVERWEKPITRLAALAAISAGFLLIGFALIAQLGLGVRLLTLSGAILMTGIVSSSEATLKLQWQRRRLRNSLGRYLSPAVAAQIASQPEEADELLGGQQADVVILMSDIRGFTSFTQQMSEANRVPDLVKRLNYYFTEVVDALHQEGATVDKFIGDACLAVFGAPIHRGNQQEAESAIRAALDIEKRLRTLNSQWKKDGEPSWEQVIVLSFGSVISGNIGSSSRMDYTVIGSAVNTASRLEKVAKECQKTIVLSEAVANLLKPTWNLEDLGEFPIRGQAHQHVYTVASVHLP